MAASSRLGRTLRAGSLSESAASIVRSDVWPAGGASSIEARTPMNLAVLRPVFERLLPDPRSGCSSPAPIAPTCARRSRSSASPAAVIGRERAPPGRRFDLYVNADPWEAVSLRRVSRQLNFFHGVAGKYNLDCPTDLPLGFDRYDRVAFPERRPPRRRMSPPASCRQIAAGWSAIRRSDALA